MLHGLKPMGMGLLFGKSTSLGLLQKISKQCPEAELTLKACELYDATFGNNNNNNSNNQTTSFNYNTKTSSITNQEK